MSSNWWNSKEGQESLVLKRVDAVAVYVNQNMDLVIRQQDPRDGRDTFVIVPKDRVEDLISGIRKAMAPA